MESILKDNVSSTVEKKPDNQCFLNIDSIQHITEPVVVLHDNIIIRINPAAEKIFNLNKERIIQCNFFDLIHPRDRLRIISLYDSRTNLNQMVFHYQCEIVDKNETIKWIEVNSIKFSLNEGEIYFNLIKEITDQIEKTQKQKMLFEMIPEAIFEFDLENREILSINPAMAKRFQKKPEEMIGKNFLEFLPEDIYEKRFKIAEKAIRENRIITNFDTRNDRNFEDMYIPINFKTGRKTLLGISKDITNYTKIEDDLKKSEKRFKEIFNSSVDAYLIIQPFDLKIMDANVEAKNRFGLKQVDLGSMTIEEIVESSEDLNINKSDNKFIDRILAGKIDKQDILLKTKHDGPVWHEIITKSVKIDGEKQFLIFAKDIRDQKIIENQMNNYKENLENTVQEKTKELNDLLIERGLLLEEIHHRVKNNLQIITSLIDLQCDSEEPKEQCVFFETLKNRIYIMSLLHEQLYKSKDFKYVHLGEYLKGIVDNLERSLVDKSKKISITLCEINEHIDLKKAISCGLIINELVSNAMKHAFPDGREGHITVDVSSSKDEYMIKIEDDGIGISNDIREDKFSSLGLQLVNMLIRQLNGSITVHSANGTQINMRFPK